MCRAKVLRTTQGSSTSTNGRINDEEEYEIEEVRKHWKQGKGVQYLVHWKGYGDKHDQWIAETGLLHARQVIEDH